MPAPMSAGAERGPKNPAICGRETRRTDRETALRAYLDAP